MYKVSVIIPVYNGERHLRECLDSVCTQTLQDIEIICVDDGSTDASREIIGEYIRNDPRVSLYCQANQYCGIARNNGLSHAQGEYVIFWDCDDYADPKALELLYEKAEKTNADICICQAYSYNETLQVKAVRKGDINKKVVPKGATFCMSDIPDQILSCTNTSVWTKLFRKSFLDRIQLWFLSFRIAEDVPFTFIALCSAKRIATVRKPLYYYRVQSSTSISNNIDSETAIALLQAFCFTADYLKANNIFPERSFVNKVLSQFRRELQKFGSLRLQLDAISYFQNHCLEALHIQPRPFGFYDNEDNEILAAGLYEKSAVEVLSQVNYKAYTQSFERFLKLGASEAELKAQKKTCSLLTEENEQLRRQLQELRTQIASLQTDNSSMAEELKQQYMKILESIPEQETAPAAASVPVQTDKAPAEKPSVLASLRSTVSRLPFTGSSGRFQKQNTNK